MRLRIIPLLILLVITVSLFGYSVRPGDLLSISVYGSGDLSSEVLVGPDGTASIPPLGNIALLGKTLEEIQSLLSSQFLNQGILTSKPQVTVSVKSYAPFMFYILGEVNKPGAIEWHEGTIGISQLLALAGGLQDGADLSSAFVVYKDGTRKHVDLSSILSAGEALKEKITEGSTLYVPTGTKAWILTMGEFRSPTLVKFNPGITLTQVIAKSGGLAETADKEEILIISDEFQGNSSSINLNSILFGRVSDPEVPAGSIVIANDSSSKSVKLLGEFNNPTSLPYRETLTLLQAIGEAGGLRQTASEGLYILRSGVAVPESFEVDKLLSGSIEDVKLNPGDTVFVPRLRERFVYVASASFGGKVEFSIDENLTLVNALVKVDLYDPSSLDSVVIVEPSGKRYDSIEKEDMLLEAGSMIIMPHGEKTVFVTGEVRNPGSLPFSNFEEITLSRAIAKSGGLSEKAGLVEVLMKDGTRLLSIEEATRSSLVLEPQSIVLVREKEQRFVYVVSSTEGGRVDFQENEAFTLRNLLARINLLNFKSSKSISIISSNGTNLEIPASELEEKDYFLEPGSIVIVPDTSTWVYLFGEVGRPGKIELDEDDLLLTRAISAGGGFSQNADISSVQVLSGTKIIDIDLDRVLKGLSTDPKIGYDDLIYVPRIDNRFVYVISDNSGGKVDFSSGEKITLRNALAKLNLVEISSEKEIRVISPDGGERRIPISSLIKTDWELETGSVVFYPQASNVANVLGRVRNPGTITLKPGIPFNLATVISAAGGFDDYADRYGITVIDSRAASITVYTMDDLSKDTPPSIPDGATVFVPEIESRYVYILGGVKEPGLKLISREEPNPTLTKLIAISGGLIDPLSKNVEIVESDQRKKLDLQAVIKGISLDPQITSGSIVYVPETSERFVYVISREKGGRVDFSSNEEITLRTALAKHNLLDFDSNSRVTVILPDGTRRERQISDLKDNDMVLSPGSIIVYPNVLRQIFVVGAVNSPGLVQFEPGEKVTLTTLIARAGGMTPLALSNKIQITDPFGRTSTVSVDPILLGKALDLTLEDGSFVYVPVYEAVRVNVIGEVRNPGIVEFYKNETPSLMLAISKAGGLTNRAATNIKITDQDREIRWFDLIEGEDIHLSAGQTVYIAGDDRYVYVSGEVNSPGKFEFSFEEEITVLRALARAGGEKITASDQVRILMPSGEILPISLAEVKNEGRDTVIEAGSTVIVPRKVIRITVLGAVNNPGLYTFSVDESHSLSDAIAKAGGIVDENQVGKIVIHDGKSVSEFTASVLQKRGDPLSDNSYIYVSSKSLISITVLGDVVRPGKYEISGEKPSLATAIAVAGGLDKSVTTLSLVGIDGTIKLVDALKTEELARSYVKDDDTIVALRNYDSFVTVVGDVKSPGIFSVSEYGELSLAELLSLAGGLASFETRGRIFISYSGKTEEVITTPEDFLTLTRRIVPPGSTIYVPYSEPARVYVFGEVQRPGVVRFYDGITAIEAVVEAGGPTSYAVLGNALLFQDPDKQPLVLDLDQQKGKPAKGNVPLTPGNIIFVPQSSIVNIKDIMSIVASSLSIVNSAVGIFK